MKQEDNITNDAHVKTEISVVQQQQQQPPQPGILLNHATFSSDPSNVVYQIVYQNQQDDMCGRHNYGMHSPTMDQFPPRPPTPISITPPDSSEGSPTVPVICGNATGKLHLNLFLCPGIHQPCIEFEEELLSPKQFTIRGDKEKQKDWKASIRIGRSTLRSHMEAGTVDFFDHEHRCSGKCQSRNYVNSPQEREEVMQLRKFKRNVNHALLQRELNGEVVSPEEIAEASGDSVQKPGTEVKYKKARGRPRGTGNKNRNVLKRESKRDDAFFETFANEEDHVPTDLRYEGVEGCTSFYEILNCLQNDPVHFWQQMQGAGVIMQFCDDIIQSAVNLKQSLMHQVPLSSNQANCLTRSVFSFGIQGDVVQRVQAIELAAARNRKNAEIIADMYNSKEQEMVDDIKDVNSNNDNNNEEIVNSESNYHSNSVEPENYIAEERS